MESQTPVIIYAMVGPMGSGKTTFALKVSAEKGAAFFSLDKTIKDFDLPVRNLEDYEHHMTQALEIIGSSAIQSLKNGRSVVFDFGGGVGHWAWLKNIADSVNADIEIYQFEVPLSVRLERVRKRNVEKPEGIYHFTMSDEEVIASKTSRETPSPSERVKIIKVI